MGPQKMILSQKLTWKWISKIVEKKATVHILYFIIYGWLIAKSSYFHTFYHHSFFIWEESLEF